MLTYRFKMHVFQDGEYSETVSTLPIGFRDEAELVSALVQFAAINSATRLHSLLRELITTPCKIELPHTKDGWGPKTSAVIFEAFPHYPKM